MKHLNDHIIKLMEKSEYPEQAVIELSRVEKRLDDEPEFGETMDRLCHDYMFPKPEDLGKYLEEIEKVIAPKFKENHYTLHFVFLMNCTEELLNRYHQKGISEDIYWDTVKDLKYKLLECMECEHCVGTFVAGWFSGFFEMNRFALGRFQFEYSSFSTDEGSYVTKNGMILHNGDFAVGFHIPSSGVPLTDEVRFDSYKRAYDFFKERFQGGPAVFICGSWLLYPKYKEILPGSMNMVKFANDFEIVRSGSDDKFNDDWRVFGHWTEYPVEEWPEDTTMRRAIKKFLLSGGKTGSGYGVIIFDGEKILNK
ncbi:MAG: acyltransferase domain-containing protein [Clostridiales bacterium]|nr:acyltransferase domain-containing protein [Clostridiales bacterium]